MVKPINKNVFASCKCKTCCRGTFIMNLTWGSNVSLTRTLHAAKVTERCYFHQHFATAKILQKDNE